MRKHGYRHQNQFSRSISLDDMVVSRRPFKNRRPSWILLNNGKTRSWIFLDFYMGYYKVLTEHCAKFQLWHPNFNPPSTFRTKISGLFIKFLMLYSHAKCMRSIIKVFKFKEIIFIKNILNMSRFGTPDNYFYAFMIS